MSEIAAARAEADSDTATFTYGEISYTIDRDLDLDFLESLDQGKLTDALKALLGSAQYATFKATRPKISDLNKIVDVAMSEIKTPLGESAP